MCAFLALPPIGAEAREVKFAKGFTDVFLGAMWTEGAKAFLVMRAGGQFGGGIDV